MVTIAPEDFARRRAKLAEQLEAPLVVATHPTTRYSNDTENWFRPNSDFWYLTGFAEPDSVLVLTPEGHATLFLRDRKPEAEIWNGRRLGVAGAESLGMDKAYSFDELDERLPSLVGSEPQAAVHHNPDIARRLPSYEDGAHLIHEMRLRKDAAEVKMLEEANRIGSLAIEAALEVAAPGVSESAVEAELWKVWRQEGTRPGYLPIVGTGANAGILHYIENNATLASGDTLLIDAGCEWGYYNSDITRTVAVGKAEPWFADLYDLVLEAQNKAIAAVRPGVRLKDIHDTAAAVLEQGLESRGWLGEPGLRGYFMHGTSHWLGLDVHDVGATKVDGESRILEAGMVLTAEPGIYVNPDFHPAPDGIPPMGIRIEDDILVTEDGHRNLTPLHKDR